MFQIMTVDDEPVAVNGLVGMLLEWGNGEYDILKAYNGVEALEKAEKVRIDILLTDIQMPVMNGLVLAEQMKKLWPRCKVIYLTGFNDFEYIQNAIRQGGVDYVLKTEGDEVILLAVEKACSELKQELLNDDMINRAKSQFHQVLPSLRRDYLLHYLRGDAETVEGRQSKFKQTSIPFEASRPVYLALGKVEDWGKYSTLGDKSLMHYAIGNITEEYLGEAVRVVSISDERMRLVWFIQPVNNQHENENVIRFLSVVRAAMEMCQETCRELLQLPISIVMGGQAYPWERLNIQFDSLILMLNSGFSSSQHQEMLVMEGQSTSDDTRTSETYFSEVEFRNRLRQLDLLEAELDQGNLLRFVEIYQSLIFIDETWLHSAKRKYVMIEMFTYLVSFFLSYLNRRDLMYSIGAEMEFDKYLLFENHASWHDMISYFNRFGEKIAQFNEHKHEDQSNQMIRKINKYIQDFMHDDLTLHKLAEVVYLSPYYLSRLYKQISGENLMDHITEVRIAKAKYLLKTTDLKIHEISDKVGIESAPYFSRLFKKMVHCTPQEYRGQS